jgi:demethylmenaquinone methyltransferase/2-methoxy-6-polyprenyl-1,4-benzoquinol methylase
MFDSIALKYDFLNHFLSFGIDRSWRRKAIRAISAYKKKPLILDVATGTGDLAIEALRIDPVKVTGIDISTKMLEEGKRKVEEKGLTAKIDLVCADSENIPFADNSFDVAMVAFGVRNFTDPLKGLSEMKRVLNNGGMIMVLEFSKPKGIIFRKLYDFYSFRFLPLVGKIVSKDKAAYHYLPESIRKFPDNESFLELLQQAGFSETRQTRLSGGIASIYTGFSYK